MSFSSTAAAPLGSCHYHSPSPLPLSLQGILLQFIQPFIVWQVQFLVPKGVPCALLLALCGDLSSICFALLCSSLLFPLLHSLLVFLFTTPLTHSLQFAVVVFISAAQFCAVVPRLLPQSCANKLRCSREAGNKLLLLRSRDAKLMGNWFESKYINGTVLLVGAG